MTESKLRMSPADYAIKQLGGVHATARAIGRTAPAISQWRKNNGHIPSGAKTAIMKVAQERDLDITLEDLHYGRVVDQDFGNGLPKHLEKVK